MWYFDSHHIAATLASQGYQLIEIGSRRCDREIRIVITRCWRVMGVMNFNFFSEKFFPFPVMYFFTLLLRHLTFKTL